MKISQLLTIHEQDDVIEDDDDNGAYDREKKVSLLILRAFRRCGLPVAEYDGSYGGVRDTHDRYGYDVLYSEDDHEATVKLEEAELDGLAKLHNSGLIGGKCEIIARTDGTLQLTFKVHPNLHSGDAKID